MLSLNINETDISFHRSIEDLENNSNEILIPTAYTNLSQPETIYARVANPPCYDIFEFTLVVENCPPVVPSGFSPNNDNANDWFNIQGRASNSSW